MLLHIYCALTAVVGAGVLGSIAYLLLLTFAGPCPPREGSVRG